MAKHLWVNMSSGYVSSAVHIAYTLQVKTERNDDYTFHAADTADASIRDMICVKRMDRFVFIQLCDTIRICRACDMCCGFDERSKNNSSTIMHFEWAITGNVLFFISR